MNWVMNLVIKLVMNLLMKSVMNLVKLSPNLVKKSIYWCTEFIADCPAMYFVFVC